MHLNLDSQMSIFWAAGHFNFILIYILTNKKNRRPGQRERGMFSNLIEKTWPQILYIHSLSLSLWLIWRSTTVIKINYDSAKYVRHLFSHYWKMNLEEYVKVEANNLWYIFSEVRKTNYIHSMGSKACQKSTSI
jgi:hypothetical protein